MARAAVHRVTEIERKLDVDGGFALPDLRGLAPAAVAAVTPARTLQLDATYFDTPDLRLIRRAITLRRRLGGDDEGWHLKRPSAGGEREELQHPVGRSARAVPRGLQRAVAVYLRGAPLGPVVRLRTRRVLYELLGDDGGLLAEVVDDTVMVTRPGEPDRTWRELEVELFGGDRGLLRAVVEGLVTAGARPPSSASKLARALGNPPRLAAPGLPPGVRPDSAAAVVLAHLGEQVERLLAEDPRVRDGAADAVHQMRVACRRLRSALATFRPLFDAAAARALSEQLGGLAGVLGAARDAEVVRAHLDAAVAAEPPELLPGPLGRRASTTLRGQEKRARAQVLAELDSARYFAVLDALEALVRTPPLTPVALRRADAVLPGLLRHSWRQAARLARTADAVRAPQQRDALLHDVRKAAKRARYAGESLAGRYGRPAARFAARMEAVQEALGEHHDSVVARTVLLELAAEAERAGEPCFGYGRLHALEQQRGVDSERRYARAWARAARRYRKGPVLDPSAAAATPV